MAPDRAGRHRGGLSLVVAALAAVLVAPGVPGAAPGDFDPTFGDDGLALPGRAGRATALAIQPDGRIVIAGDDDDGIAVVRFDPQGRLDPGFGTSGVARFVLPSIAAPRALLLYPDGRILIGGQSPTLGADGFVVRLNGDGSPDIPFGEGGQVITDPEHPHPPVGFPVLHLVRQPDGRILGVGGVGGLQFVRYTDAGVADLSFSPNGYASGGVPPVGAGKIFTVAQQPDGRLVVGWSANPNGGRLRRHEQSGAGDPGFGFLGTVAWGFGGFNEELRAAAVRPDGRIVVAGFLNGQVGLIQYEPDGDLDPTFGTGGRATTPVCVFCNVRDIALRPDGKIVVTGEESDAMFFLAQYLPNGAIDTSFGTNGVVTARILGIDLPDQLVLQPDGRIVISGSVGGQAYETRLMAARFLGDCGNGVLQAGEACDDGNLVGGDCCSPGCTHEAAGSPCDADGDLCSSDSCDAGGTCTPGPSAPAPVCRQAQQTSLLVRDGDVDEKDLLTWKWVRGDATALEALGDVDATAYALCVYEESSGPLLLLRATAPRGGQCGAKPCWRASAAGVRYRDAERTPEGLRVLRVRAAGASKSKVTIRGGGVTLLAPGELPGSLPLPVPQPVRVRAQLRNGVGECWEAVYENALRNEAGQFQGRTP